MIGRITALDDKPPDAKDLKPGPFIDPLVIKRVEYVWGYTPWGRLGTTYRWGQAAVDLPPTHAWKHIELELDQ